MTISLPLASDAYDASNERQTRRALEDAISDLQNQLALLLTSYGTLSIGETDITLANGANNDVSIGYATYVRISGPTANFTITGLAGGERGRVVFLRNNVSAGNMTIANESASSAVGNRIFTQTGADVTAHPARSSAILLYDSDLAQWVVVATYG